MLTLAVRLRRVLDRTDAAVQSAWGLTPDDIASDDYARCQEAALADGYEAIRYPSAAVARAGGGGAAQETVRGADNLAVFADVLHPGSDVRVIRSELLPIADG